MPLFKNLFSAWKIQSFNFKFNLGFVNLAQHVPLKREVSGSLSFDSTPQGQTLLLAVHFPPETFPLERPLIAGPVSPLPQTQIAAFPKITLSSAAKAGLFSTLIAGATSYLNEYLITHHIAEEKRFYITHTAQLGLQLLVAPQILPTLTASFGSMLLDKSGLSERKMMLAGGAAYLGMMVYQIYLRPELTLLTATETSLCLAGTVLGTNWGERAFKEPLCFLRDAKKATRALIQKGCSLSTEAFSHLKLPRPF